MINVNCLNNIAACGLKLFSDEYNTESSFEDAQAVLVRSAKMHDMELSDNLLAIARAGAGVNNIPLDKCAEEGIVVFNTPGANANAVKEQVIAAIGQLVANAAIALGMEVYGYDPYVSVKAAWNLSSEVKYISDVKDIYKECNYITVHVPALDSTKGMINKEAFDLMQDGTVIINCARDVLVDEAAIGEALKSGRVKTYVSDFPNPTTAKMEGAIVLPHLGASTAEAEDNCAIMAVNELRNFIENGNIVNSVNYPNCDCGVCATKGRITVCHKNVPTVISKITTVLGAAGINISSMANQSRGDYAYSLLDIEASAPEAVVEELSAIEGVIKVRVIK